MIWAVHISDGVLAPMYWQAGLLVAGLLAWVGSWRLRDEEVPRVALLTAAFFIASLIHVRVGPTSAHLLLNGLGGVLLGWRVALAIPLALLLQALLFSHGGFFALGVNACVMVVPALGASWLFGLGRRLPWLGLGWFRAALIAFCVLIWTLSLVYSLALLFTDHQQGESEGRQGDIQDSRAETGPYPDSPPGQAATSAQDQKPAARSKLWRFTYRANALTFHPLTLATAGLLSLLLAWGESRLQHPPEFPLGLLTGELAVLATISLNCLALLLGGETDWTYLVLFLVVVHLPIAVVEGLVLGFTVSFLARVKPEMLGWPPENPGRKVA